MKNFNFYLFSLVIGVVFAYGQKDSSENEYALKNPNNKTKNESDSKSLEKEVRKYNQQSLLIKPDERFLINQNRKPGFLEDDEYIPPVRITVGRKRQNVHLTDDSGRYKVLLENFQHERPTYFQAALGAISTHIINQKNGEYIPYPPNGDPHNYPAYRGHPQAMEPPVIRAYERSTSFNIDAPPLVDFSQQNSRKVFANNIYQRGFPEFESFGSGFYSDNFFNNDASKQIRNSEQINHWYKGQTNEFAPAERIF